MNNLAGVVQQLRKERDQAARVLESLDAALAALSGGPHKRTGTRKLSAAGRARIAAAARARWAKFRRQGGQKKTMSAAARKKTAAAGLRQYMGHPPQLPYINR